MSRRFSDAATVVPAVVTAPEADALTSASTSVVPASAGPALYRSQELNANLTKGSGNVGDVTQLLRAWHPGEDVRAYRDRLVAENVLGRTTRARALDVVQQVLMRRYFPDGAREPGTRLARLVQSALQTDVIVRLLYYHAALAEHLLYRVAADALYETRRRGVEWVNVMELRRFIAEASAAAAVPSADGAAAKPYSASVVEKLAGAALTALRDFRIVAGAQRKRILPVRLPHEVVGYVAHALRDAGATASRIVEHPDWRLFLLAPAEVEAALLDADRHGHFHYQAAGTIRRFDWTYPSLDAYVDAIAGSTAA